LVARQLLILCCVYVESMLFPYFGWLLGCLAACHGVARVFPDGRYAVRRFCLVSWVFWVVSRALICGF